MHFCTFFRMPEAASEGIAMNGAETFFMGLTTMGVIALAVAVVALVIYV